MFVLIQATKAVLEVRPILSPMTHGLRINFGDAYIGQERIPLPKGWLTDRDTDDDSYHHFGTIAFVNGDRDSSDVEVPLMP